MKQGWEIKKLGELSQRKDAVVSGPFGSNLKVSDYKNEGVPILRLQNIGKGFFIDKDIKFISEKKAEELKYHSFASGDIALAKLGIPVGKTCIIPNYLKSGIITADVVRIRPDKNVMDYKFLEYFLNTDLSVSQLTGNISGATRPRVNLSDVRDIKTPVPPLPEQKRIVAILDEAFAAIAKAKANAEQNLKNAKELFESYLQSVFENKGEDWEERRFEDLCDLITCGVAATPKYVEESEGVPFLSAQNVRNGEVVLDKYRFISKQLHQELTKKNKPSKGDILYSRVGAKFGEAGVVEHDFEFSVYVSLTLIKPKSNKLDNYFLKYYLNSPRVKHVAQKSISSSGVPNLNVRDVREFLIKFPSVSVQRRIASQIKIVSNEIKKLEAVYQAIINNLEELKKSILQKAFSGELTKVEVAA